MDYNETNFLPMCKKYGLKRIIRSPDFRIAFVAAIIFSLVCGTLRVSEEMIVDISIILVTVSAALLAVVIAGLAIVVSISDDNFVKLLKKMNIYDNILFVFWYSAIIACISIVSTTISYALAKILQRDIILCNYIINNIIFTIALGISIFFTFYVLFPVITLVGTTMRWGLYRGAFIEVGYDNIKE